jgi:hypothetical protein
MLCDISIRIGMRGESFLGKNKLISGLKRRMRRRIRAKARRIVSKVPVTEENGESLPPVFPLKGSLL